MRKIENIKYSDFEETVLDIYLPESRKFSTFIYFHGGGLESGDKKDAEILASYLVKKGIAVVSANYRIYPTAVFPDYINDCASCVAWVFSRIAEYGQSDNIYVGGSSAGAYISMMLCFDSKYLGLYGIKPNMIKGYIHDAGQPTSHFNILRERGIDTRRVIVDETAPLYFVGRDSEYSNMVFIVSDNDMENRMEQTMLVQSTLKHFGYYAQIEIIHGTHGEYILKKDRDGTGVFGKIIYKYIKKWNLSFQR